MISPTAIVHRLRDEEVKLLAKLRSGRVVTAQSPAYQSMTWGQRIADNVAATMGSWPFIIIQSVILAAWIIMNEVGGAKAWDPYPFILLNLALSFQAAYAAPFIMMSQNRQAAIDRAEAQNDYHVNIKAELEIELLHQKIDLLRETEMLELIRTIQRLEERLAAANTRQDAALPPSQES